jgi:hypothetical protein
VAGTEAGLLAIIAFHVAYVLDRVTTEFQEYPEEGSRSCLSSQRLSQQLACCLSLSGVSYLLILSLCFLGTTPTNICYYLCFILLQTLLYSMVKFLFVVCLLSLLPSSLALSLIWFFDCSFACLLACFGFVPFIYLSRTWKEGSSLYSAIITIMKHLT